MNHLAYIAASYLLALGVPMTLAIGAGLRSRRAKRRLATLDPRNAR
jgi:hypothetical protein